MSEIQPAPSGPHITPFEPTGVLTFVHVVCSCGHDLVTSPGQNPGEVIGQCANVGVCGLAEETGQVLITTTVGLVSPVQESK